MIYIMNKSGTSLHILQTLIGEKGNIIKNFVNKFDNLDEMDNFCEDINFQNRKEREKERERLCITLYLFKN